MEYKRTVRTAFLRGRAGLVCAALLIAIVPIAASFTPVAAQTPGGDHSVSVQFIGQVTAVTPAQGHPSEFVLLVHSGQSIDFHVAPTAVVNALSAEADVEGFQPGDYARVTAHRASHVWVAGRVDYDVQPIVVGPKIITFVATVLRVSPDGKRVTVRLDNGSLRVVTIVPQTTFRLDGQLTGAPLVLAKGNEVQVRARQVKGGWVAIAVDVRTSPFSLAARSSAA